MDIDNINSAASSLIISSDYLLDDMYSIYQQASGLGWTALAYRSGHSAKYLLETDGSAEAITFPISLNGRLGVYIGCVNGTNEFILSAGGSKAIVTVSNAYVKPELLYKDNTIYEAFGLAGYFSGESLTLAPVKGKNARIAYIKLVSLTEEEYSLYMTPNSYDKCFAIDNDGYTDFYNGLIPDEEQLKYNVLQKPALQAGISELIWCLGTTGMLNYDSPAAYGYFAEDEESCRPLNMFDLKDSSGRQIDYESQLRKGDRRAREDILRFSSKNKSKSGWPLSILAEEGKKLGVAVTASFRMMAFYSISDLAMFNGPIYSKLQPANYSNMKLREYVKKVLLECAAVPGVAGVLLDFARYPEVFSGAELEADEKTSIMNNFMQELSHEIRALRGKKKISVRIPVDCGVRGEGLNYEAWIKNGWLDRLITTNLSYENWYDYSGYLKLCHENGAEYYLGITADLTGEDITVEQEKLMEQGLFVQNNTYLCITDYLNRAYCGYNDGVDGVYLFNTLNDVQFIHNISPKFRYLGDKERMKKWYALERRSEAVSDEITIIFDNRQENY